MVRPASSSIALMRRSPPCGRSESWIAAPCAATSSNASAASAWLKITSLSMRRSCEHEVQDRASLSDGKSPCHVMKFRLGINYWPVSSAMYWWRRFDASEVKSDFQRIRAAGFDSVRIFLLWEDFQPLPTHISSQALNNLVTVADIAAHNDLSLMPTLFTGHMSGVNWIPDWALESWPARSPRFRVVAGGRVVNRDIKNWYSDKRVIRAQARLAGEVAAALGKHPALWAYDLGNENSNCVVPPTRAAAAAWLDLMVAAIRAEDSSHPITIGLHMEDLEEDRRLTPRDAGRVCDFLSMHGYPIYAAWARSATDEMLLPFLGLITRWMSGREVLFQ